MIPKYLETYHYRKYREYCSTKCINIVFEQNDKEDNEKYSLRGKYKGYLYGMKFFSALLLRKKSVPNYEIYNHFKYHLNARVSKLGEADAIRDIMNLMCDEFPNKGIKNL